MSRTAHHVPLHRWNVRENPDAFDPDWSIPVGHAIWDLRFPAGCRRVPVKLRHTVQGGGYFHGHGGGQAVQVGAREIEGGMRAGWRAFAASAVKAHRAGGDLDALVEPDGRTRHEAIWDAF